MVHDPAPVPVHVCPFICKLVFRLISDFKKNAYTPVEEGNAVIHQKKQVGRGLVETFFKGNPLSYFEYVQLQKTVKENESYMILLTCSVNEQGHMSGEKKHCC